MMYQLPIDMMTRMISVPRATKSPPFQSASRPYGLSTASLVIAGGATGATGSESAIVAEAGAGSAAIVGCGTATRAAAAVMEINSAAMKLDKRVFIMCFL